MTPAEFESAHKKYIHDMERVAGKVLRFYPDLVGEAVSQCVLALWEVHPGLDPGVSKSTFTYAAYWTARKALLYAKREEGRCRPLDGISLEDAERHLSRLGVDVEWSPEQAAQAERDEVESITQDQERLGHLRHAIMGLPSQERKVIEAIYLRGLTTTQTAVSLDATINEVKSWRQSGLRKLRQQVGALTK